MTTGCGAELQVRATNVGTQATSPPLPLKPIGDLEHQDIIRRRREGAAEITTELELAGIALVLALLGPHDVERRAGMPFPAKDRVENCRAWLERLLFFRADPGRDNPAPHG